MILHNGDKNIELLVSDDSYSYEAIMGEDTLTLYFSHPGYLDVPVGSWCDFYGKRYSLKKDSNFKKNGERNFEYTLVLETSKADTLLWKVRNTVDNRIKFPYTAKPKEHLRMLVENLNRRGTGWKVGDCIDAAEKAIEYNHTYILDGLNQLAQAYETEWQITEVDNVKTVHLRKVEYNKENPLTLSYGKGHGFKVGVGRESGEIPPEIILVQGTDRNINFSKYGAKELLLPKSQTMVYEGRTYKSSDDGTCVMRADSELTTGKEESIDCTEIYPSRVGTVSSVIEVDAKNNFYDFVDKDIPVNLNFEECLIEGESMTVIFQTGMLVGKEFEVKYIHEVKDKKEARRFEIVPQEIDGITMPDGTVWSPTVGDTYAVFGIQLPDAYICDNDTQTGASWDMFKEAAKYLYEHEGKKFTFTGTLDGIWAKKRWLSIGGKIVLGGYVLFSDAQFHPDGSLIRMIGVKRYFSNPYSPEIELSNDPVGTSITSDLNKIETNEVVVDDKHKQALQFIKRRFRDAQETMSMLANSLLNFSGAINPITVATMQMLVGDESLQFRFVNSKTNPVQISHNITYNASMQILNAPSGIIQHMTLGITTVSSEHKAGEYKYWDMAEYNSPVLIDPSKKFYLYAKCSKDNPSGTFLLSETAIKLEGIAAHYHLLVGVLNSEYDGDRSLVELYGFTEILPGRITTERILSPDGKTYFDLVKGEIGGNIQIKAGSSGLENIEEWEAAHREIEDATKAAKDAADSVDGLHDYVDGAFADGVISEAESKAIEKYINTVNNTKSAIEATYNKLYTNGYLEGAAKTILLNAKISLSGAIDNLIAAINVAIADGQTTVAEKQNVDDKFALFNSALASFNTAVEGANKAIQDKLKGYSDECTADLKVLNTQISAQVTRVDSLTNRIDTSGWITTSDGNRLYASKELENGNTLISYINQTAGETTIHSSKINLQGAVTINALHSDLVNEINSKAYRSDLGNLAFKDAVEAAQLGSTIIVGGYLNTDLIKVRRIDADSGFIGGFTLDNGSLYWKGYGWWGGDARSVRLGVPSDDKSGVIDVNFNGSATGRFGVRAVGSNAGGACIYASRYSSESERSYPNMNNTYAGFFDGGVFVKGNISSELCLADNFGAIVSRHADGNIEYNQGIDYNFGTMLFRKGLLVRSN